MIRAALAILAAILAAVSVAALIALPCYMLGSSGASGQTTGLPAGTG